MATTAPPVPAVIPMIYGLFRAQAVCVAARLGIADLLAEAPRSAQDLAAAVHSDAGALDRLLRYLVAEGVFSRGSDGRYALNAAAEPLRSNVPGSVRPMALFYGSPMIWNAWGNLLASVTTGRTGFEAAHGAPIFDYLEERAEDAALFNDFMTSMIARRPRLSSADFSGVSTVADIGGGHAANLIEVLRAHEKLRGVLFDLPSVVAGASQVIAAAGLSDRCQIVGGSLFDEVPSGADVYVLSNILHDWNDDDCIRILACCRAAMRPGTRLIVAELIVPEQDAPSLARTIDLQMLVVTGGVQRTLGQFQRLFERAGFGAARVLPQGFIEVLAV